MPKVKLITTNLQLLQKQTVQTPDADKLVERFTLRSNLPIRRRYTIYQYRNKENNMPNVVFFSFKKEGRSVVLTIKGRVVSPSYTNLNFRVKDLLQRRKTEDSTVIKQAISRRAFSHNVGVVKNEL